MTKKAHVVSTLLLFVVCLCAYAYGARSATARVVLSTVYFQNGSVELAAEFEDDLKTVQAALEADPDIGLQIDGYGRNPGSAAKNLEISRKRAEAVRRWFVERGVDAGRLAVGSFGDSRPAARRDKAEDADAADRVEILQVSLKRPAVHLPAVRYEFSPVMEGRAVMHDFIVQNKGTAPLEIQKVRTD